MNLLASLKSKLRVLDLKSQLKSAKDESNESTQMANGQRVLDSISKGYTGIFPRKDIAAGLSAVLAGLKELGATPKLERSEGLETTDQDFWLACKKGESFSAWGAAGTKNLLAAYNELAAAFAAKKPGESSPPKPEVKPAASSTPPKPAATTPAPSIKPAATALPKPSVVAAKPVVSFGPKPSFENLRGVERAAAAMKWKADREAFFLAEAERQIAAEEAAGKIDPTAGKAVTAASIASEILRQQAEAAKPKPSAWSREAATRRDKVKALAKELASKDPQ